MTRRVAIVGAALSDTGTVSGTSLQLIQQASARALTDSGLSKDEIDGFAGHGTLLPPVEVTEYLGIRPTWGDSTNVGGSSWELMAQHAVAAIERGEAEVVLIAYGSTARSDVKQRRRTAVTPMTASGPLQFEAPYGHPLIAKYAMAARRHMHEYGTTIEQLAEIAVAARLHAANNPDAFYRDPITVDDVLSSRLIADPFTQLHCCIRTDGGGAVILASEERARDLARTPVYVLGSGQALSHVSMSQWTDFTESPCVKSGAAAFGAAGVTPNDIDVWNLYDSFTYTVLATLEGLGVCGKGEGGDFVSDGRLRPGGSFALNPDGGGLSACHPGMRGIFLLVEAVRQLRGECGVRQVPDAATAAVNATGGFFSATGTMILGRD